MDLRLWMLLGSEMWGSAADPCSCLGLSACGLKVWGFYGF